MAWKSALPGSPVVMCHQSMVTGSAAAADGATDAAGAAALGAARWGGALLRGAAAGTGRDRSGPRTPSNPSVRLGFDTTRPPVIRHSILGWVRRCAVRQLLPALATGRSPGHGAARAGARKFRVATGDCFRLGTIRTIAWTVKSVFRFMPQCSSTVERSPRRFACTRSKLSVHYATWPPPQSDQRSSPADEPRRSLEIAAQAGVSVPTVSKVINGRADVAPETRRRVEAVIREQRLPALGPGPADGADPRAHLPRAGERVGAGDRPRRRARRRRSTIWRSSCRRCRAVGRPGRGWIEGVLARRPTGVIAVFSDLSEYDARPAPDARHPARGRRPDRRAAPRHPVDRRDELERRPRRRPATCSASATAGSASSAGRRGSCAAGPGSTATARRWTRPACPVDPRADQPRPTSRSSEGIEQGPRAARACRTARPRSSPATTSRRSASTRPPARLGCTSRRT